MSAVTRLSRFKSFRSIERYRPKRVFSLRSQVFDRLWRSQRPCHTSRL